MDAPGHYSIFCTCSRNCSISTFISTAARVVSRSCDFDDRVLASRLSSCIRKSRRRPAGSLPAMMRRISSTCDAEAVEFLVDIQSLQHERQFLLEAFLIHFGLQFRQALIQAGADAAAHFG